MKAFKQLLLTHSLFGNCEVYRDIDCILLILIVIFSWVIKKALLKMYNGQLLFIRKCFMAHWNANNDKFRHIFENPHSWFKYTYIIYKNKSKPFFKSYAYSKESVLSFGFAV